MSAVPIAVAFHSLFCFHGSDESDSEPYLWCIGFSLGGRNITHAPDAPRLSGSPEFFFSPGSHGSIGGPMGIGANRIIPPSVGRFNTTLEPIVLNAAGRTIEVPGTVGLIGILLEEDATSDEGADAAHAAINELVRIEMQEALDDISMAGVGAEVLQAMAAGKSPEAAASAIFEGRVDRLVQRIQRYARSTAVDAIVSKLSFPGAIVEGADPDEFLGVSVNIFNLADLDQTTHTQRREIADRITQPEVHPEASDFNYNIHGEAWRRVEKFTTPITDQVPPGRRQVTGINRQGRPPRLFIAHLGGRFADGSPWLLTRGQVMNMLSAKTHTFFVRGESGAEADVIIQPDPFNPQFPSVTTVADNDPSNNLGRLPQCPLAIDHLRPAD
ncbi:hypothetical protein QTI24_18685 [Variovorax sp. J22P240]|uniref:hypothetical protein n=1 Tax=Variovorax sp. J22P240 TaxID=3053514 RepID=UPI0025773AC5|nr:hypothetical protein [Variovorax sp. J22P240]MDM0000651.1 hypothetical protein [Variovorax sp. J22P240]